MTVYPGISVITLGVDDMRTTLAFYKRLGWRLCEAISNDQIGFFALNNIVLALYARDLLAADSGLAGASGTGSTDPGYSAMTLAQNFVSEHAVRRAFSQAMHAGAQALVRPQATAWGGFHAVVADPDGHVWELAHNPFVELTAEGTLALPD